MESPSAKQHRPNPDFEFQSVISPKYLSKKSVQSIKTQFAKNLPFPHITLDNFLNPDFFQKLQTQIKLLEFYKESNDLFDKWQSKDLGFLLKCAKNQVPKDFIPEEMKQLSSDQVEILTQFRKNIYSDEFRSFIESITQVGKLKDFPDMGAAFYAPGDSLLCHNDQVSERAVAYILYLTDAREESQPKDISKTVWTEDMGGTLDLFSCDGPGNPTQITKRIIPSSNRLSLFAVTPDSYHQVAAINGNVDQVRLAIGGWFHFATPQEIPPTLPPVKIPIFNPLIADDHDYSDICSPIYFQSTEKLENKFQTDSCLEMRTFFTDTFYTNLLNHFQEILPDATEISPYNIQHYHQIHPTNPEFAKLELFLKSNQFLKLLKNITHLDLIGSTPVTVSHFGKGDYTIIHDQDPMSKMYSLELRIVLTDSDPKDWDEHSGGFLTYCDEEAACISLFPHPNTLALVFRDKSVFKYLKLQNHRAPSTGQFIVDIAYSIDMSQIDENSDDSDEEST